MHKIIFATLALTALFSGEVYSQTTTWSTVANENQQFSLSSSRTVRYGAGSSWVERVLSGTQSCTNATFGRDPAYGVQKTCQVSSTTTSSGTTSGTTTSWTTVANERQQFSLSTSRTVRYGTGSSWIQRTLSGTQSCTNETFGSDPAYGLAKMCQVSSTTTSTSGSTSGTTTTWSTIANEKSSFSLSSVRNVRYGAGSSWVERSLSGTQTCTNETFGRDPAYGVQKVCQVSSSTSTGGGTTTPTSYSANLSWTIPSTRTNGTPLAVSELRGYEVYYTNDTGSISRSIPVSGATTVRTVVSNLTSGRYHFSISAVDANGLKSPLSAVTPVTFP